MIVAYYMVSNLNVMLLLHLMELLDLVVEDVLTNLMTTLVLKLLNIPMIVVYLITTLMLVEMNQTVYIVMELVVLPLLVLMPMI